MAEKETPPVGVKPDASHLLDECPRLLDHRGFPICHLITYPSDSLYVHCCGNQYYLQDVICASHLHSGSYHCASVPCICPDGLPSSK